VDSDVVFGVTVVAAEAAGSDDGVTIRLDVVG